MPDVERAKVTFRLPKPLVRQAKHFAVDHDLGLQDVVEEALRQFLGRKGAK